ncbi:hypothetical protein F5887DRAFT_988256 [Amanita rubescens]|nr:hypothetical protein F5887DRAFT_988256 [Amanita rubescens]
MVSYSPFFSSGLLAPPVTIYNQKDLPVHVSLEDEEMVDASPRMIGLSPAAAPSSPMTIPDDSDVETEFKIFDRITPTLSRTRSSASGRSALLSSCELSRIITDMETTGVGLASAHITADSGCHAAAGQNQMTPRSPSQPPNGQRLRRRRSSLAGATSPKCAIKSPTKSVGHALELQRLLGSPTRTRSNSLNLAAAATDILTGNKVIPEQNTFLTRLRSCSTSSFRRRTLRRVSMAPPAPPPTAPLPDLPASLADTPLCGFLPVPPKTAIPIMNRAPLAQKAAVFPIDAAPTMCRRGRDRSYSINTHYRIDELKEN